jgi:hypothetical protein
MSLKVNVHVRDQMFPIFCGSGTQRIRWLSDVALHRYEHFNGAGSDPGLAKGMRFENGDLIDIESIISNKLKAEEHVWVILNEDLALMEAERKKEY